MRVSIVKVTRKGQVTIPKAIRDKLKINEGDYLIVSFENDFIIFKKVEIPTWDEIFKYGTDFSKDKGITKRDIIKAIKEVRRNIA